MSYGVSFQDVDAMWEADTARLWEDLNEDKYSIDDLLKGVDEALKPLRDALDILQNIEGDHVEYDKVVSYADDLQSLIRNLEDDRRREFR